MISCTFSDISIQHKYVHLLRLINKSKKWISEGGSILGDIRAVRVEVGRLRNGCENRGYVGSDLCFSRLISFNNFARFSMSLKFIRRQSNTIEIRYHNNIKVLKT